MRAAVVHAFGEPVRIEERPIPQPRAGEVLVKMAASGVCHTDLHAADGDWPAKPDLPLVLGHEGTGIVAALGEGVTDLKEGDAVGIAWLHDACGTCEYCVSGWETLCPKQNKSGYSVDGTYAEYAIGASDYVARLPRNADLAALAPILCAGVTTYQGLKQTEARPGEWVAISGIGGLGHLGVQYAKALGFRVVALDVAEAKLELARTLGADLVVNARDDDAIKQVMRATGGGAHGVLVTAVSPQAFSQAIRLARRNGTVVLNGLPPGDFPTPIMDVVLKCITIRGSIVGSREQLAEAIAFAVEGKVHSHNRYLPLAAINEAFADLREGKVEGRIVLDIAGTI